MFQTYFFCTKVSINIKGYITVKIFQTVHQGFFEYSNSYFNASSRIQRNCNIVRFCKIKMQKMEKFFLEFALVNYSLIGQSLRVAQRVAK